MFIAGEYRKKAHGFREAANTAPTPKQESEFRVLEQSFTQLANNEEWLSQNHGNALAAEPARRELVTLAKEEEHILRCLGAALILQWHAIPKKLQRELFDSAGSMGDLMDTLELRGQVARFLHKHKSRDAE
jgi:hypothetical protein